MGMRFMHGICQIAEKHGLLPETNPAATPRELTIQAAIGQSASQVLVTKGRPASCELFGHPHVFARRNASRDMLQATTVCSKVWAP